MSLIYVEKIAIFFFVRVATIDTVFLYCIWFAVYRSESKRMGLELVLASKVGGLVFIIILFSVVRIFCVDCVSLKS